MPTKAAVSRLSTLGRWRLPEILFWLAAAASVPLLTEYHLVLTEIAIIALFAVSLDLILGYAGIASLGHTAFFGAGAYAAGLFAIHVTNDPLLGLVAGAVAAAILGFATSFLVLRGADLTRLMVTLGVALVLGEIANKAGKITGGADGLQGVFMAPILGRFEFDLFGHVGYVYCLVVFFVLFVVARRIVVSPFGLSLLAIRDNPLRARAIGIPVNARLTSVYTISAAIAGVAGALLAQTAQFVSIDVLAFHRSADALLMLVIGGTGYLYGGIVGAVAFKVLQEILSVWTPQYWTFWIGAILVAIVLIGRQRIGNGVMGVWARLTGKGGAA
ncbi:MAG: branched-chain amino acid ABC transporter permease [Proteobacteria bacterium]|nr:branched-chain amino acid ABC transporter permease [Pseudomonadota bacterium]